MTDLAALTVVNVDIIGAVISAVSRVGQRDRDHLYGNFYRLRILDGSVVVKIGPMAFGKGPPGSAELYSARERQSA